MATAVLVASRGPPCDFLGIKTSLRPASSSTKGVTAGRMVTFHAVITNTGTTKAHGLAFDLFLPGNFVSITTRSSPDSSVDIPTVRVTDGRVSFGNHRVPAGKKVNLYAKVGIKKCHPAGTVRFQGVAYQRNTSTHIVCESPITPVAVKVSSSTKKFPKTPRWDDNTCTAAPTKVPTQAPFV